MSVEFIEILYRFIKIYHKYANFDMFILTVIIMKLYRTCYYQYWVQIYFIILMKKQVNFDFRYRFDYFRDD